MSSPPRASPLQRSRSRSPPKSRRGGRTRRGRSRGGEVKREEEEEVVVDPVVEAANAAIGSQLETYMKERGVTTLFAEITEAILAVQPTNPVHFISGYLRDRYPDLIQKPMPLATLYTAELDSEEEERRAEHFEETLHYSDVDSDDSDPEPPGFATRHRGAVSAKVLTDEEVSVGWEAEKPIPKSAANAARIRSILSRSTSCSCFPEDQREMVMERVYLVVKRKGDIIISEGEEGDVAYFVDEGEAEAFKMVKGVGKTKAEREMMEDVIRYFNPGSCVNELCLLYPNESYVTVRARTDMRLWGLKRRTFKFLTLSYTLWREEVGFAALQSIPLFKDLTRREMETISVALKPSLFAVGDTIVRQGDPGFVVYYLETGRVKVIQQEHPGAPPVTLATLEPGSYFGEVAMVSDRPRQASVVAETKVKCVCIDRPAIARLFTEPSDVLKRDMEALNQFMSRKI